MVEQLLESLLLICFPLLPKIATSGVGTFDLSFVILMLQTVSGSQGDLWSFYLLMYADCSVWF